MAGKDKKFFTFNGKAGYAQRFTDGQIIRMLDAGRLEEARRALVQNAIIRYVLGGVLNWISHPEYLLIVSYENKATVLKATVRYRDEEYEVEVPLG